MVLLVPLTTQYLTSRILSIIQSDNSPTPDIHQARTGSWLYSLLSQPWYRFINSPSLTVHDGSDTAVNGTAMIYSQPPTDHIPDHITKLEEVSMPMVEP